MKTTMLFAVAVTVPLIASAGVNPKNGNFFISYQDIVLKDPFHELELTRTYNSRASDTGWFGAGWGSRFETRLVAMPDGTAAVKENGTGQVTYYRPRGKVDFQAGVARIVAAATQQAHLSAEDAETLSKNLARDEDLRVRTVLKYSVPVEFPVDTALQGDDCSMAAILRAVDGYKRITCERSTDFFDLQGRLIRHENVDGYSISLAYDGKRPTSIADSRGQSIQLKWTDGGLLDSASSGSEFRVNYIYDKNLDLVKSVDTIGHQYDYEYDGHHNMTRIGYIDNSSLRIDYLIPENGIVKSVTERSGDQRLYEYRSDPADAYHTWTRITAIDAAGRQTSREYEYHSRLSESGTEQLMRLSSSNALGRTDTIYDDKGRVIRKTNAEGNVAEFTYDQVNGKLSTVVENGVKTSFHYDRHGELVRAESGKGQVIHIKYGNKKQIQRMVEINRTQHTNRTLTFKYNQAGKPTEIHLLGTGKIEVEYDDKGEITKVSSARGVKMALEVTQIFQNLLSVVQVGGAQFQKQ